LTAEAGGSVSELSGDSKMELVSHSRVAVAEVQGQFVNQEEGECPPLKATAK
jgi:hypothetical protein